MYFHLRLFYLFSNIAKAEVKAEPWVVRAYQKQLVRVPLGPHVACPTKTSRLKPAVVIFGICVNAKLTAKEEQNALPQRL